MLIIKKGNILEAKENIICHQVNCQGVMGGGLALQIATQYPNVEQEYKRYCNKYDNNYEELKGMDLVIRISENQSISNCFTQKPNFDTDYEAIKRCFERLSSISRYTKRSVCMPYKMGCGIANGNWEIIVDILLDIFTDVDIIIYKYEKENTNE